jgi:tRNA G18 (ribose-2'-O)-methylase SpoU
MDKKIYLILHNIRSQHNVGSIFRTADGAGVKKIFLTGYTPKPVDEFGKVKSEIHKTALGAEETIEWEYCRDIGKLIHRFRKKKYSDEHIFLVGLEQTETAVDFKKFKPKFPLVLIAGNEIRGISEKILEKCDAVIKIPMRGKKESLNVSVAVGIALYAISL